MRSPRLLLFAAALLLSRSALLADDDASPTPTPPATPEALADIANFSNMAHSAVDINDLAQAEKYYAKLLDVDAPDEAKKTALFDMFDSYRTHQVYSKAIAVGETIHQLFPADPETPDLLLKLGQLYRDTGAYQLAIARFYNVLNAALRVDQAQFAKYKAYSTQAQFEIAQTFVTSGDYQQAARTYSMLDRLDLSPEEKAHTEFQVAYCTFLTHDFAGAVSAAQQFLETYGDSQYAPQCHYLLSVALRALGRADAASDETLTLLKMSKSLSGHDAAEWTYWQKKTGNQLANEFYQSGDYLRALAIYQAMAKLGDNPDWQWPVIYQVGLCFERLLLPDRAAEAYHYILDASNKVLSGGTPLDQDLTELTHMADWRSKHLEWKDGAETQLAELLGPTAGADALRQTRSPTQSVTP